MTQQHKYLLAGTVFMTVLVLLALPYLQARLNYLLHPVKEAPEAVGVQPEGIIEPVLFESNQVSIPSLGITAPLIYVTEKSEAVYQEALQRGVVHYPGTAKPGELGNTYFFGHSSDYVWSPGEYKTVFALLPQIEVGAEIVLTDADGQAFHYHVTETKVVGPRDMTVLDQFDYQKKLVTLQTSYPLGTALQRYIVVGELKVDAELE